AACFFRNLLPTARFNSRTSQPRDPGMTALPPRAVKPTEVHGSRCRGPFSLEGGDKSLPSKGKAAAPGRGAARPIQSAFAPSGGGIGSFKVFYVQYTALVDLGGVRAGLDGRATHAAPDPRRMAR